MNAEFEPGEWTPAAGRVRWDGPAGFATLSVDDGPDGAWRVVSSGAVEAGEGSLPLALVPVGAWSFRLEVDDGRSVHRAVEAFEIPPPVGLGAFEAEVLDPASEIASSGGYWVGYPFAFRWFPEDGFPLVLDGSGRVVWWAPPDPNGGLVMRVRPGRDGRSILALQDFEDGARRVVYRYALDGSERSATPVPDASHDFWENEDGTFTYIGYELSDVELVPGQPAPAAADVLRTTDGSSAFSFFEDYPSDPWYTCNHADWDGFVLGAAEWTHANTLLRVGDEWALSVRHLDAIVGVEGHELRWQVGGSLATVLAEGDGVELHHPHLSEAWRADDGSLHLLVFDNGTHLPAPVTSRVVELAVTDGVARAVWSLPDPLGRYTGFLGDAHRLPGGNTLVSWTAHGELVEVTPAGDPVWTWTLDRQLGRGVYVTSLAP